MEETTFEGRRATKGEGGESGFGEKKYQKKEGSIFFRFEFGKIGIVGVFQVETSGRGGWRKRRRSDGQQNI